MQNVDKDKVCLIYIYTLDLKHFHIVIFYPGDCIFKSKIPWHLYKPVVCFIFFLWTEEKLNKGEFVIHFLFMFFVGNECDKQVSDSRSATFSSFTEAIFVKWSIQDGKQKDDKLSPVVVTVISLLSVLNFFFLGCICIVYVVAMNGNF